MFNFVWTLARRTHQHPACCGDSPMYVLVARSDDDRGVDRNPLLSLVLECSSDRRLPLFGWSLLNMYNQALFCLGTCDIIGGRWTEVTLKWSGRLSRYSTSADRLISLMLSNLFWTFRWSPLWLRAFLSPTRDNKEVHTSDACIFDDGSQICLAKGLWRWSN